MAERCPTCDRETCPRIAPMSMASLGTWRRDCEAHAIDWRSRALAAEAREQNYRRALSKIADGDCWRADETALYALESNDPKGVDRG